MEEQKWKTLKAIHNFVLTLKEVFPKDLSLCLYERLLSKITQDDEEAADKVCGPFKVFITDFSHEIMEEKPFPPNTRIAYNDKIFIKLSKFLDLLEKEEKKTIYFHLLTIHAINDPEGKALEKLDLVFHGDKFPVDRSSNEGAFIGSIFDGAKDLVGGMGQNDGEIPSNPMAAMAGIMQSFPKIMGGIQQGVLKGELDPKKMLTEMYNTLGTLINEVPSEIGEKMEEKEHEKHGKKNED